MRDLGNGAMTSEITITHAGPEHAGDYRCMARNLYGTDELLFRLFVKGETYSVKHIKHKSHNFFNKGLD